MSYEEFEHLAGGIQAFATTAALIAGGLWAYWRFNLAREAHPHLEFTADIQFVDERHDCWIVELVSFLENKGKAQQTIKHFRFDLYGLDDGDPLETSERFGGQVYFPNMIAEGSWLPSQSKYFFIEPGVRAKYSFVARVPKSAKTIILHSWFKYDEKHGHTAECTVACPHSNE